MVNFGPLAAEMSSLVWGTPDNFNGFRVLAALLHGTLVVGVSQTAALNRGRLLYSAGRPSRWALTHILVSSFFFLFFFSPNLSVSRLGCVTAATSFTMFGCPLGCYTIYTFSGALAPWRNFATCKIDFASKSCVLLYWQRYCTALQQRGQPNLAAWYKEWNYGTFAESATYIWLNGHQVWHRPTF